MVRSMLFVFLLLGAPALAQEVTEGERAGLLQVSGSIYPTVSLNQQSVMNLVGGHAAFQFDEKYAFRGDLLAYTSLQSGSHVFNDYFLIEGGFIRNFTSKRFDYFVGIELGLSRVQLYREPQHVIQNAPPVPKYYQPVLDLTTGVKFHVSNYFYFYAETKLLNNRHPEQTALQSNLMFTGGLGLQLPTKKLLSP